MSTSHRAVVLVASLLFVCPLAAAQHAAPQPPPAKEPPATTEKAADKTPAAPTLDVPIPWKVGQTLRYATELVKSETGPGKREKAITTATAEIRTIAIDKDGILQHWVSKDSRHDIVEGDVETERKIAEATQQLDGMPMHVQLTPEGNFKALGNVEEIATRMRTVLRPVMLELMQAQLAKSALKPGSDALAKAQSEVPKQVDALMGRMTDTKLLTALFGKQPTYYNFFTGGGVEDGASYALDTEIENPVGAGNFPAKMTFGMYTAKDDPEDVYGEWEVTIDPVKGAKTLLDTVERLYDRKITEAERKDLPETVSIVHSGFVLIHKPTGVVEMYEDQQTSKFAHNASYERNRMRLLEGGHGHEWKEQIPQATDPSLSSSEHDGQLCANSAGDIQAGIAACTRLIDAASTPDKTRAQWYAARAQFRLRDDKPALMRADLDKAIALRNDDVSLYGSRVIAAFRMKDHASALQDAERMIALDPKLARGYFYKGAALEGLKRYRESLVALDKAVVLAPNDPMVYDSRCWVRVLAGDFSGAKADCDKAIAMDPGEWNPYNSRGYIHYRTGQHALAIADNSKSIELKADTASSWYVRGLSRRASGDEAGAKADIDKALQLDAEVAERYRGYESAK